MAATNPNAPVGVDAPRGRKYGRRPSSRSRRHDAFARLRALVSRRDVLDLGAEQAVEQRVGGGTLLRRAVDDQHAPQARASRRPPPWPARDSTARPPSVTSVSAPNAWLEQVHIRVYELCCRQTPNGIASSRLTSSVGATPSSARRRDIGSTGVGPVKQWDARSFDHGVSIPRTTARRRCAPPDRL